MRDPNERVAVFVEGANMFYAQRSLGWHLDFARILAYCTRERELYNAFYYTGVQVPANPPTTGLFDGLTASRVYHS
jgi:uncharacterized LabA/DUF88 family protein